MKLGLGILASTLALGLVQADRSGSARASESPYLRTMDPDAAKVLTDRLRFIQEIYEPNAADTAQLEAEWSRLLGMHEKYVKETELTIQRIHLSMTLVATEPGQTSEQSQPMMDKFQGQLASLYSKAPLSLANIIAKTEAGLPKDAVKAGRIRLQAKFAPLLDRIGGRLEVRRLDWLMEPAWVLSERPSIPVAPPTPRKKLTREELQQRLPQVTIVPATPEEQAEAEQINRAMRENAAALQPPAASGEPATLGTALKPPSPNQPVSSPPMVLPPAVQPAAPAREILPAPALSEWQDHVEKSYSRFGMTDAQKQIAADILSQSRKRAEQFTGDNVEQFSTARKNNDEARLKELNHELDVIYDELVQRVESVATLEQKLKAAEKESAAKK
jgi:hypothetical protein